MDPHPADPAGPDAGAPDLVSLPGVVLVVDDSRFVRASLVRGLSHAFALQQADSGERAWELLLLDPTIRAVLSDLTMPGLDGFDLLARVRGSRLERLRALPFAVLSGADDPQQRARAEALGADRFVVKGAPIDALVDWLRERLAAAPATDAGPSASAPSAAGTTTEGSSAHAAADPGPDAIPTPDTIRIDVLPGERPPQEADRTEGAAIDARAFDPAGTDAAEPASLRPVAVPPAAPAGDAAAALPRLVPDPLQRWYQATVARIAGSGDAPPALIRLSAIGVEDLPARLRRGVRAADALHLQGGDTAWLCLPASAALALRLGLRFGVLAAGRPAGARVQVCIAPVDPARAHEALVAVSATRAELPLASGLTIEAIGGAWGAAWRCTLPWPAARLLVA